jgi:hypothetical protein
MAMTLRRRAAGVLFGAGALVLCAPVLTPGAQAQVGECFDGTGNVVPCPTDPPPTTPTTVPTPTLPRPTNPPPTSPPPPPPPTAAPPPAATAPPATSDDNPPATSGNVDDTPDPTTAAPTTAATTSTTAKRKAKAKASTTTTRASTTTTTEAEERIAVSPLANVGPGDDGGSTGAKTIGAIAGAALLLVLAILAPELRARFTRRPTAA